jgi:stage V sporulation protein SpoVS
MTILKISAKQDTEYTKSVAGAICWQFSENGKCHARAAKGAAINNLIKAAAITQSRVEKANVIIENQEEDCAC